jgi:hypothetical protein
MEHPIFGTSLELFPVNMELRSLLLEDRPQAQQLIHMCYRHNKPAEFICFENKCKWERLVCPDCDHKNCAGLSTVKIENHNNIIQTRYYRGFSYFELHDSLRNELTNLARIIEKTIRNMTDVFLNDLKPSFVTPEQMDIENPKFNPNVITIDLNQQSMAQPYNYYGMNALYAMQNTRTALTNLKSQFRKLLETFFDDIKKTVK